MQKVNKKLRRAFWVTGFNISFVFMFGTSQAFASTTIPIANEAQLVSIGTPSGPLDGVYVLTESFSVTPTSNDTYISGEFTGTIDGDGFTIFGLNKPLFNHLGVGSLIKDLNLDAVTVSGRGMLANRADGTIENVHVTGNVTGSGGPEGTGGLVGTVGSSEASISGSSATGNVTGDYDVGGLVGSSFGSISSSWYLGDVRGEGSVGGLAGSSSGSISGSFAGGSVLGIDSYTGGLVGISDGAISNSYASGDVTGRDFVGGLVGIQQNNNIINSYASGDVTGRDFVGGLVGAYVGRPFWDSISNTYASGDVTGSDSVGGSVGVVYGPMDPSFFSGKVNGMDSDSDSYVAPFSNTGLLGILNAGSDDPIFFVASNINSGRPYLLSNPPPSREMVIEEVAPRIGLTTLVTQALDVLKKPVGFTVANSSTNKLELALNDQVKDDKSGEIIGAKLLIGQTLTTFLSIDNLLQLEINFEANKSLQMWVKSEDDQFVLLGDITFDKDGNAVLPGIEFKKSGSYEFIFVNSDKKGLTQPELVNKVSVLTVYVN
jgi:M26 IgA1-specific Metallo-endopeptidase N-terminal region/The GLUG motif